MMFAVLKWISSDFNFEQRVERTKSERAVGGIDRRHREDRVGGFLCRGVYRRVW